MRIITESDPVIFFESGPGRLDLAGLNQPALIEAKACAEQALKAYQDEVDRQEAAGVWDRGKLDALYGVYQSLWQAYSNLYRRVNRS